MKDDLRIAAAEAEVDRARAQLIETLNDAAGLLEPRKILGEVWESAKSKGADLAEDAVDAVASRPMLIGGALAAVAAFLARGPIKGAAVKAYGAMTSSDGKKTASKTSRSAKGEGKVEPVMNEPAGQTKSNRRRAPARRKTKMETIS